MPETFLDGRVVLHDGDCLAVLATLPDASVDSVATDPPYHLTSIVKWFGANGAKAPKVGATGAYARGARGFMGQTWDGGDIAFRPELWAQVLRVLKPGGHLVAFSGTRTYHRMVCAIEDAGFEIRDRMLDLLASDAAVQAFLATLDAAQVEAFARCCEESGFGGELAWIYGSGFPKSHDVAKGIDKAAGATSVGARQWDGWGTALKPAFEPICLARKLLDGTVVQTVLKHGTGALNIDRCRVDAPKGIASGGNKTSSPLHMDRDGGINRVAQRAEAHTLGRFPANILHDGSDEVLAAFPSGTSGGRSISAGTPGTGSWRAHEGRDGSVVRTTDYARSSDSGSAARFFYSAKADADDRIGSGHPTVKPVDLMRWLVRLVTPPGGTVLDPFAGTGTTGEAAWREGFSAVLIEREAAYRADIARRMALCGAGPVERRTQSLKAAIAAGRKGVAALGPLFGEGAA